VQAQQARRFVTHSSGGGDGSAIRDLKLISTRRIVDRRVAKNFSPQRMTPGQRDCGAFSVRLLSSMNAGAPSTSYLERRAA